MKKILMILLIILISLGSFGCTSVPKKIDLPKLEFVQTLPLSNDIINHIKEEKEKIGVAPQPVILKKDNITYIAFKQEDFNKITAKLELSKFMEEIISLQHERAKLYVIEINSLKRLAEIQRIETETFQRMYLTAMDQLQDERWHSTVEGWFYKILVIGQTVAILLLL